MLNKFVAIGLGAIIALAPLAAIAQTEQLAQAAPAATPTRAWRSPAAITAPGIAPTPYPPPGPPGHRRQGLRPTTCTTCTRRRPLRRADRSARHGLGVNQMGLPGGRSVRPPSLLSCRWARGSRSAARMFLRLLTPAIGAVTAGPVLGLAFPGLFVCFVRFALPEPAHPARSLRCFPCFGEHDSSALRRSTRIGVTDADPRQRPPWADFRPAAPSRAAIAN